jgi:hypothetical protein
MKLTIDVMGKRRAKATADVNAYFAAEAAPLIHIERAHAAKLVQAQAVAAGAEPSAPFASEASARGITPQALAALVIAKAAASDPIMEREALRQGLLIQVEAAQTPQALNQILGGAGISNG